MAIPASRFAGLAGMSDDAVHAKTGHTWQQWKETLDAISAFQLSHRDIALHLRTEHGLSSWWSQTITIGYERIRGLRQIGQRREGTFDVNKSKTYPVGVATLYRAFSDKQRRDRWLGPMGLSIRTAHREKSMRLSWPDGTAVDVHFVAKDAGKSRVSIQHRKLSTRKDVEAMRTFWSDRLSKLAAVLSPTRPT